MTDGIVHELQRAANDPTKSVTEVLRLALTAASKLRLKGTTTWIRHELDGYPNTKDLPPYRCIRGKAQGRNPIHGWRPVIFQGEDHQELIRKLAESVEVERFTQPVSALQELLKESEKNGRVLVGPPDEAIRLLAEVSGTTLTSHFASAPQWSQLQSTAHRG